MKIALLTDSFTTGGGLEHIYQIARGLPHHEFVVAARGGPDTKRLTSLSNVAIERGGYGPAIVQRHQVDLIHIHHLRPLVAHQMTVAPGRPLLYTAHGIHLRAYEFKHGLGNGVAALARTWLERACLQKPDVTIALTESDRAFLTDRLFAPRTVVIPNGIETNEADELLTEKFSRPAAIGFKFITVARFHFQKGHDLLLHAVARIQAAARGLDSRFILIGDGPTRPAMQELARTLGIADLVTFPGASDATNEWLREANCLILPSRWEGLPYALLEAGRQGCDVICSDAPGNRDVADGGSCAVLFKNGDVGDLAQKIIAYTAGQGTGLGQLLQRRIHSTYAQSAVLAQLDALYLCTAAAAALP